MNECLHPSRIPTADLYLTDGSHLELQRDWRRGLGWWRVDDDGRRRLTVAQAFEWAPRILRHEVLIEAQNLASVTLQECLRDGGGDPERHSASAALIGEIHAAMVALCDDPSIRSFGHDPADHMRS
jgi:hypothetical protein